MERRIATLRVEARATPEVLGELVVAEGFAGIDGRCDPARVHRELLGWASERDALVTVATVLGRRIVGYLILARPRDEYWSAAGDHVLEVVFAEVAGPYRRHGVFEAMAEALQREPLFERSIVFARLMRPYWDRRRAGLSGWGYRRMMVGFTRAFGFEPFHANDPILALRPMNAGVRRIGSRVEDGEVARFSWVARHGSPAARTARSA
jgi:hypothetical protein